MRFRDLHDITTVLDTLESGAQPTDEELAAARQATDREKRILEARSERWEYWKPSVCMG